MKIFKISILFLLIIFVGIQFIPIKYNKNSKTDKTDFLNGNNVPKKIGEIFKTSCYDCHSDNTAYPWYNKIQPVSWMLESHIDEGKKALNFSNFNNYSNRRKKSKIKSIISQITNNKMPPSYYLLMHNNSRLSNDDISLIEDWLNEFYDNLNK